MMDSLDIPDLEGAPSVDVWDRLFEQASCAPKPKTKATRPTKPRRARRHRVQNNQFVKSLAEEFGQRFPNVGQAFVQAMQHAGGRIKPVRVGKRRPVKDVSQLTPKEQEVYQGLMRQVGHDEDRLLSLADLVQHGPKTAHHISGRVIDTLVTKYPRMNEVSYYLDFSESVGGCGRYVPREQVSQLKNRRHLHYFSICSSYRNQMRLNGKAFFDPFGRGTEVYHRLSDGSWMLMSLCKFSFFLWAQQHAVFEFLDQHYDEVTRVQRVDAIRAKQPLHPKSAETNPTPHVAGEGHTSWCRPMSQRQTSMFSPNLKRRLNIGKMIHDGAKRSKCESWSIAEKFRSFKNATKTV